MTNDPKIWGKTIFWGIATAICYAVMFSNTELILHMAHTTLPSCIVPSRRGRSEPWRRTGSCVGAPTTATAVSG